MTHLALESRRLEPIVMSALLSTTMLETENTIAALQQNNLREMLRVIIGGAPTTPDFSERAGADAFSNDALKGVAICSGWMEEARLGGA